MINRGHHYLIRGGVKTPIRPHPNKTPKGIIKSGQSNVFNFEKSEMNRARQGGVQSIDIVESDGSLV